MHQIGVVGLSYRHAGVEEIARLSVPRSEVASRLEALAATLGAAESLYLGTCNRVELLYATRDGRPAVDARESVFRILSGREPQPGEAARLLRAWTGEAAVEHLFLVACGLDSAQTGEHEIAAQLRTAWEDARAARACGPLLDRLLGEALGMSRRVRRSMSARAPSLGDLAAERVLEHLRGAPRRVTLLGVSPMTRRCAARLHEAQVPLLIVNRSVESAAELANSVAGEWRSLDDFRNAPAPSGALVLAAGGGQTLLDEGVLARLKDPGAAPTLIIDFGVPPNVAPEAARRAGLPRLGMDELIAAAQGERLTQLVRLAPVRAAIDERLARLRAELATRAIGARLAGLKGDFEQIAALEVERALRRELRTLDARERAQLERLASGLARRLAHLPLAGLRAAAVSAGPEAVEAFFDAAKSGRARASTRARADGKPA
jgi:glutamyl-tRNA reductase